MIHGITTALDNDAIFAIVIIVDFCSAKKLLKVEFLNPKSSANAFKEWKKTSAEERSYFLKTFHSLVLKNKKSNDLCIAHNNLRSQPVFMLISKLKLKSLENYLKNGERKIDIWYKKNGYEYIYFDKNSNFFENINTMEQLKEYNEK